MGIFGKGKAASAAKGEYPGFSALQSIGLIFPQEMAAAARDFQSDAALRGKEVRLLAYSDGRRKDLPADLDFPVLCKSDRAWGRWKSPEAESFKNFAPQVLIDVLPVAGHPLDRWISGLNADFKIGRMVRQLPIYNLTLDASKTEGPAGLFREILYYLQFINKEK